MVFKRRRTAYQRRFARRANGYIRRRPRRGMMVSRSGGYRRYGKAISRNPITSDTFFVKLKYSEIRNIIGGALTSSSYVWRGNSIYDPDFTSAGGNVSGKTEWFGFYSDCVVLGSKCKVKIINGTPQMMQCCLYPNRTSTGVGVGNGDLREIPYGSTTTTGIYSSNAQNNPRTISKYFSTSKMYCVGKSEISNNPTFWHQNTTNPSNQWFWILQCEVPATPDALSWVQDVQITYYCMFKRRVNVTV